MASTRLSGGPNSTQQPATELCHSRPVSGQGPGTYQAVQFSEKTEGSWSPVMQLVQWWSGITERRVDLRWGRPKERLMNLLLSVTSVLRAAGSGWKEGPRVSLQP